jgi:hypothetical protein
MAHWSSLLFHSDIVLAAVAAAVLLEVARRIVR